MLDIKSDQPVDLTGEKFCMEVFIEALRRRKPPLSPAPPVFGRPRGGGSLRGGVARKLPEKRRETVFAV